MTRKTSITAVLLFGSGLSALIDQTVWLREFRLIFGASLSFYGRLELMVSALAARGVRHVHVV